MVGTVLALKSIADNTYAVEWRWTGLGISIVSHVFVVEGMLLGARLKDAEQKARERRSRSNVTTDPQLRFHHLRRAMCHVDPGDEGNPYDSDNAV
ncbi:MAG: hypothetical protein ACREBR_02845, partial [bacterium]